MPCLGIAAAKPFSSASCRLLLASFFKMAATSTGAAFSCSSGVMAGGATMGRSRSDIYRKQQISMHLSHDLYSFSRNLCKWG